MGLSKAERDEVRRLWRADYGGAETKALAEKFGVSERTIWRLTCGRRSGRARRRDKRRDGEYLELLSEDLVVWCVGQLDEGVALRDVLAAARDLAKPGHEHLSAYRLRRALASRGYSVAASRSLGAARPDGSRAPAVKRSVERRRANTLHQYDETRAPQMYVDLETGEYVYDSGVAIDWRSAQRGRAPLWIAQTQDDASCARHFVPIPTPSAEAVLVALAEAWLPKADPLAMPFFGLPEMVYGDNGSWLSSETVREALRALQVRVAFHEPYHPEAKGKVERAFRSTASFWTQERLSRSAVEETAAGRSRRVLARFCAEDLPLFFARLNLLVNNRAHATTGEAPYARWVRLAEAHPETLRMPPPAQVFSELALARLATSVRPDVSVRLPGGERVGLDWSVFGGLVGREVVVRYRRLERGREPAEGETVLIEFEGERLEAPRRAPAPERHLVAAERPKTAAELLSEAAARVDYSRDDLTRHAAAASAEWPLAAVARPFDSGAAEALEKRAVLVSRYEAIERLQRAGRLSTPLSDADRTLARAWLPGETIDSESLEHLIRYGTVLTQPDEGSASAASA
ncbi:MAG TPA: hypothetical protein VMW52_06300 [Phycisphaerae bacterium]|nr:hypothetical protein [Phycisphaerae bacterium]